MSDETRIVLTDDDFEDNAARRSDTAAGPVAAPLAPPPPPPPPSGALPPLASRPGGTGARAGSQPWGGLANGGSGLPTWVHDSHVAPLLSGGIAMVIAWAVTQITGVADISTTTSVGGDGVAGLWVAVISVISCTFVLAFDRLLAEAWEAAAARAARAVLPALALGFVSGFLANVVYLTIFNHVIEASFRSGQFHDDDPLFYLARVVGWAIFGAGLGATYGLVERSQQRAINGVLGGAAGGAIGGLIFQFTAVHIHSVGFSRLVGLLAIGLLVASAMFLVETARREAWLRVVAGGMAGKEFVLYHEVTRIGASPQCEIFLLKDPAVAALHAQIHDQAGRRTLSVAAGAQVLVNGTTVTQHELRAGDQLQIGTTTIAYAERPPVNHPQFRTENPWT